MASSESVCVSVAISPRLISLRMISGTATPKYSATSLTVEPELMRIRSVAPRAASSIGVNGVVIGATAAPSAARRPAHRHARRAAGLAARGLRVDHDAAAPAGRARPLLARARIARRALARGLGGACGLAGARLGNTIGVRAPRILAGSACERHRRGRRGCRRLGCVGERHRRGRRGLGGSLRRRGGCARGPIQGRDRELLLHRRRGGLRLDAGRVELREQILGRETLRLRDLVNTFACHVSQAILRSVRQSSRAGAARARARPARPRGAGTRRRRRRLPGPGAAARGRASPSPRARRLARAQPWRRHAHRPRSAGVALIAPL